MTGPTPARVFRDIDEYRRIRNKYELAVPEYFNFGTDVVDVWASRTPETRALWWVGPDGEERHLTFQALRRRTNQLGNALRSAGLGPGDRLMVLLPSIPEWWETMVAAEKIGLVAIPATTQLTEKDIAFRAHTADITAVVTDAAGADKVDHLGDDVSTLRTRILVSDEPRVGWSSYDTIMSAAPGELERPRTRTHDPALIYFTSGTTGPPKMVLHSRGSYGIGHTITADFWLSLRPGEVHWNLSDTGWAKTAYAGYFGPWIQGATIFVAYQPGRFDPTETLSLLEHIPIESMCAPPTVYRLLVQADLDDFAPRALRQCRAAGEALNPEVLHKWEAATGLGIREGYGQTETVLLCGSLTGLPIKPGSMGLPPPGIDLAIVDDDGRRLSSGETGEIAVRIAPERPLGLFREYLGNAEATARSHRGDWYLTGDCARVDEDGYFWFEARADDIITSSAYRIGPFEVESALMEHPSVVEVGVVGKPDPQRTELVKAFIVLARGYSPSEELVTELQEHVKRTTAPYKYPREIEFIDELPKTVTGKIRRTELRERA